MSTKKTTTVSDESIVDSVNFMSSQFDDFNHQLKELISAVNDKNNENKRITVENSILKNEIITLAIRVNSNKNLSNGVWKL